ncbi:MAG: helix-turn-helix domain-containing protein [Dermatophilus congolensis]|nr:helix-turn-helix domain-containing protein [Dermatophilus congolensis]
MAPGDLDRILSTADGGSSILARALAILQIVRRGGGLSAREISAAADLPRTTTYRLVNQLEAAGFLVEHDGLFHPGKQLSGLRDEARHLVDFAHPIQAALAAETGLAAILTVRVHLLALTLHGVPGRLARGAAFVVGESHGLHAGASATPLLALAPAAVIDSVLTGNLRRYTAATPTAADLPAVLAKIRTDGHAVSHGQVQPEWSAVGVPVLIDDTPVCCLSLAAPHHFLDEQAALRALHVGVERLVASVPTTLGHSLWQPSTPEGDIT